MSIQHRGLWKQALLSLRPLETINHESSPSGFCLVSAQKPSAQKGLGWLQKEEMAGLACRKAQDILDFSHEKWALMMETYHRIMPQIQCDMKLRFSCFRFLFFNNYQFILLNPFRFFNQSPTPPTSFYNTNHYAIKKKLLLRDQHIHLCTPI